MKIILPPKEKLIITNKEDPLKYYYWPVAGAFYRKRLSDAVSLLTRNDKYDKLLDIGFGSGIFFPELSKLSKELYGIETHDNVNEVCKVMSDMEIKVNLKKGDIMGMPYDNDFFDAVVSISTLEHIENLDKASGEMIRILKPGGMLVLGFPVRNMVTDLIFRICGNNPRKIHPSSHDDIIKVFKSKMDMIDIKKFPNLFLNSLGLYITVSFKKK